MKNFAASVLGVIGWFGMMLLLFAVMGFYVHAFVDGAHEWFGWRGWWVPVLAFAVIFISRGFALLAIMCVGGYGAYYVWDWPLWLVVPIFFPGLAFVFAGLMMAAIGAMMDRTSRE